MTRSSERGIALLVAIFMTLIASVLGSSMVAMSQTETLSSANYRSVSQSRYAAESGMAVAINHLLYTYVPAGPAGDPLAGYDMTVTPVTFNGAPVVLSSDPDVAWNYPVAAKQNAFAAASTGALNVNNGQVTYRASATLLSMESFLNVLSGQQSTLQTWQITGEGTSGGATAAEVTVSAIIERDSINAFNYAAFAKGGGCGALDISGGANTGSYDSGDPLPPSGTPNINNAQGDVGTNGNLDVSGAKTTINGTLSTPLAGVGNCTTNNVTAATIKGKADVSEGLIELPYPIDYPDPEPIMPKPPLVNHDFTQGGGCPAGATFCAASPNGATITPTTPDTVVSLGNVSVGALAELHLNAGIYQVNSFDLAGNADLIIDSGPVIFQVEGDSVAKPISINGNGIANPSFVAADLMFIYGGTGAITINGGAETSAVVYAPNADITLNGNDDFYGSLIGNTLKLTGGGTLNYDIALDDIFKMPGNAAMSAFSWDSF